MFKNGVNTDGFTVWFNVMPADAFSGWPELTYTFGSTGLTSELQTESFDSDLIKLKICVDNTHGGISDDFEGFKLTEADGSSVTISASCSPFTTFDLSQYRLIGFKTTISDF